MVFGLKLLKGAKNAPAEPASDPEPSNPTSVGGKGVTVNEFIARAKRGREKGLEPTKPELIAYARYLGIDPIADGDLMWIVSEALHAPLPAEWTEHQDGSERIFYYNVLTQKSSWTHPLEQLHRDTYKRIVDFRSGDKSREAQQNDLNSLRRRCEDQERDAHKEVQAWVEHFDDQGKKFYYNANEKRSVWTDPRPAVCHTLYLQMKTLRELSKICGKEGPGPVSKGQLSDFGGYSLGMERLEREDREERMMQGDSGRPKGREVAPMAELGLDRDRSAEAFAGADLDSSADAEQRRRKKKQRRQREGGIKESEDLTDDPGKQDKRSSLTDVKYSSAGSAVEEVRAALGVSEATPHQFGAARGLGVRLPDLPGDGLSTVGRTKVRAGIKLEPLS